MGLKKSLPTNVDQARKGVFYTTYFIFINYLLMVSYYVGI